MAGAFLFQTKKSYKKIIVIAIGVILMAGLLFLLLEHQVLRERILQSAQEGNISGRERIWSKVLMLIRENPIFGVGFTGYSFFAQVTFGGFLSPHNVILEVICYTGIVGLIIYISFLYSVFNLGYKSYKNKKLLQPVLLPIPLIGLIFTGQILTTKIGWMTFAYIVGSTAIKAFPYKILQHKSIA